MPEFLKKWLESQTDENKELLLNFFDGDPDAILKMIELVGGEPEYDYSGTD